MDRLRVTPAFLIGILMLRPTSAICGGPAEKDVWTIHGFVRFLDVSGGCWGLAGYDGRIFHPINMPDGFALDGLRVSATVLLREDIAGICPGKIVEIQGIGRSGADLPESFP